MFETLLGEIKNIGLNIANRASSPLFGTFVFSFLLFNWRLIIYLFWGDSSAFETIANISAYYNEMTKVQFFMNCFGWPIFTTLFYLFIYPFPARYVYLFHKAQAEKLIDLKNQIEGKRLLSLEESNELKMRYQNLKNTFGDLLKDKDAEIANLKQEIQRLGHQNVIEEKEDDDTSLGKFSSLEFESFKLKEISKVFEKYMDKFSNGAPISGINLTSEQLSVLRLLDLIRTNVGKYYLTEKGKIYAKKLKGF